MDREKKNQIIINTYSVIITCFAIWGSYSIYKGALTFDKNPISGNFLESELFGFLFFFGFIISLGTGWDSYRAVDVYADGRKEENAADGCLATLLNNLIIKPGLITIILYYILYFIVELVLVVVPYLGSGLLLLGVVAVFHWIKILSCKPQRYPMFFGMALCITLYIGVGCFLYTRIDGKEINLNFVKNIPQKVSPSFTHPILDPVLQLDGAYSPNNLFDFKYKGTDLKRFGLRNNVKNISITAVSGNKLNAKAICNMSFEQNGMLRNIDHKKIFQKSSFEKYYTYDKNGLLIINSFGLEKKYFYGENEACVQIEYDDDYPDNIALINWKLIRNQIGDVYRIDIKSTFYLKKWDERKNKSVLGDQDGEPTEETFIIDYQYDNKGNWIYLHAEDPVYLDIHRAITYYE